MFEVLFWWLFDISDILDVMHYNGVLILLVSNKKQQGHSC